VAIIKIKYNIDDLVSIKNNNKIWKVVSIHTSSYGCVVSIVYDLQCDNRIIIVKESAIER